MRADREEFGEPVSPPVVLPPEILNSLHLLMGHGVGNDRDRRDERRGGIVEDRMILRDRHMADSGRDPFEGRKESRSAEHPGQERSSGGVEMVLREGMNESTVSLEQPAQPRSRIRSSLRERERVVVLKKTDG